MAVCKTTHDARRYARRLRYRRSHRTSTATLRWGSMAVRPLSDSNSRPLDCTAFPSRFASRPQTQVRGLVSVSSLVSSHAAHAPCPPSDLERGAGTPGGRRPGRAPKEWCEREAGGAPSGSLLAFPSEEALHVTARTHVWSGHLRGAWRAESRLGRRPSPRRGCISESGLPGACFKPCLTRAKRAADGWDTPCARGSG